MVKVDKDKCIGCGLCESIAPKVFEIKDGKARVKKDILDSKTKDAIDSCPVEAISE
jgi:ferredoxin